MQINTALKELFSIITNLATNQKKTTKDIKECSGIITSDMLEFLIETHSLEVIENSEGIFSPENFLSNIEIPEKLFEYLSNTEKSMFKNIRELISRNFIAYKIPVETLKKYPLAFIPDLIPLNTEIFLAIHELDPGYIFNYKNFTEKLKNEFFKKNIDVKLIRLILEYTIFEGNSAPEELFLQEEKPSEKVKEIIYQTLEDNLFSPDKSKPQAFRNALLELKKKNSKLAEKFSTSMEKLRSKYENEKIDVDFKNRIIKDILSKYFSAESTYNYFNEEIFQPWFFDESKNSKLVDWSPIFQLLSFGYLEDKEIVKISLLERTGNYLSNSTGAVLFLNDIFTAPPIFFKAIFKFVDFRAISFVVKNLTTKNSSSERTANLVNFRENILKFKNELNKFLERVHGTDEEKKYSDLVELLENL